MSTQNEFRSKARTCLSFLVDITKIAENEVSSSELIELWWAFRYLGPMFNIGFTEFLAIGVIALVVIGPKQLPEVARVVGRLLGELKRATSDLSGGLLEVTRDVKSTIEDTKADIIKEGHKIVDSVTQAENQAEDLDSEDTNHSDETEKLDGKS